MHILFSFIGFVVSSQTKNFWRCEQRNKCRGRLHEVIASGQLILVKDHEHAKKVKAVKRLNRRKRNIRRIAPRNPESWKKVVPEENPIGSPSKGIAKNFFVFVSRQ